MICVPPAFCKGYARNDLVEFLSGRIRFLLTKAARRGARIFWLRAPATPPGMRVRTGRFDGLRSCGKPSHPQLIEELVRQGHMEIHRGVAPPPTAVTCDLSGEAPERWSDPASST